MNTLFFFHVSFGPVAMVAMAAMVAMWPFRNFGWDAHGYDAPSALRRAAELFEGPLAEVPPRDTGVKHVDFTKKKMEDLGIS